MNSFPVLCSNKQKGLYSRLEANFKALSNKPDTVMTKLTLRASGDNNEKALRNRQRAMQILITGKPYFLGQLPRVFSCWFTWLPSGAFNISFNVTPESSTLTPSLGRTLPH